MGKKSRMTEINSSNKNNCNNLLKEALAIILDIESLNRVEWDTLSLVLLFSKGRRSCNGFVYTGNGDFDGWSPGSIPFVKKMEEFRDAMVHGGDRPWESALIRIAKSDLNFSIELEYDDPLRWKPHGKSLSFSEYADSLRPK